MITVPATQRTTINFKYKQNNQYISISDIEYIEADEWLSKIYTFDDSIVCARRLKNLQSTLENYSFLRCHKGYIVNMAKIVNINARMITLDNGTVIPVGRTYKETVKCEFNKFLNDT